MFDQIIRQNEIKVVKVRHLCNNHHLSLSSDQLIGTGALLHVITTLLIGWFPNFVINPLSNKKPAAIIRVIKTKCFCFWSIAEITVKIIVSNPRTGISVFKALIAPCWDSTKVFTDKFVESQHGAIKALNTLMPVLGLLTIILTVFSAILQKQNQFVFVTLIIAAGFLLISGLITKFGNQPIHSVVMTWSKASTPINWSEQRDKWWLLHKLRTLTTFISFCLIIWSNIRNN